MASPTPELLKERLEAVRDGIVSLLENSFPGDVPAERLLTAGSPFLQFKAEENKNALKGVRVVTMLDWRRRAIKETAGDVGGTAFLKDVSVPQLCETPAFVVGDVAKHFVFEATNYAYSLVINAAKKYAMPEDEAMEDAGFNEPKPERYVVGVTNMCLRIEYDLGHDSIQFALQCDGFCESMRHNYDVQVPYLPMMCVTPLL